MTYEIVHRKAPPPAPEGAACAAAGCGCEATAAAVENGSPAFRRAVWIVLGLNAGMFALEVVQGQLAGSMALQADALDFAGDSATYGLSLFALTQSLEFRSKAALVKGVSLGLMGVYLLVAALWRTFVDGAPDALRVRHLTQQAVVTSHRNLRRPKCRRRSRRSRRPRRPGRPR